MNKIALAYGQALLSLANDEKCASIYGQQLSDLLTVFDDDALMAFRSVEFSKDDQKTVVSSVCSSFKENIVNFLMVLIDNQRMAYLPLIVQVYHQLLDEQCGILRGECLSARSLGESQLQQLNAAFSQQLHKTVILTNTLDDSLIAGFKIVLNGMIYDYTISNQINELKNQLKKGVSR